MYSLTHSTIREFYRPRSVGQLARGNLKMLPTIKVALPCFLLLATIVGRARAFDFEPRGGWGPLWINQTEPEGEIDQLGDLTVRRLGSRDLFQEENLINLLLRNLVIPIIIIVVTFTFTLLRYGPASNPKWVLWGHDIFGPLSGANIIVIYIRFRSFKLLNVPHISLDATVIEYQAGRWSTVPR